MKLTNLLTTILFSLCTLLISSCVEDDNAAPISFKDIDSPNLKLQFPPIRTYSYTLQGGDGNYTASCNQPEIVEAKIVQGDNASEKALSLKTISRGEAVITITDDSGNSLFVNVKVDYYTQEFLVTKQDVFIKGKLSDAEKKKVTEKALRTIPVKESGGYKFVYTNGEEATGSVCVYKEKYGDKAVEGTFERKEAEGMGEVAGYTYELTFADGKYLFHTASYQPSRSDMMVTIAFYEDVKDRFIADYPALESIHTAQALSIPSNLVY